LSGGQCAHNAHLFESLAVFNFYGHERFLTQNKERIIPDDNPFLRGIDGEDQSTDLIN